MEREIYDVVIIGGGIGGLMCAYRLIQNQSELSVLILERGKSLEERSCPILAGKVKKCIKCKPCSIMEGMAGAGAFSDGKYNITTEYGGWLQNMMDEETVLDYIRQADSILVKYGADNEVYMPNNELKTLCLKYDLHMQQAEVKHLGTDANYNTMLNFIHSMDDQITIQTESIVVDVDKDTHVITYTSKQEKKTVVGDKIVFAVGRVGNGMFETLHALDKIAPGTANEDTLLYGIKRKYYSARPEVKNFELVAAPGIYALGDGAGFTRSLS